NFSGSIGWIHKISDNLNLSTNVGTSWRPPNISELYIFGKHQSSVEYGLLRFNFDENNKVVASNLTDNENLKIEPELGYNFLQSLEFKKNNFQWVLSSYYNYIENYIFAKPAGITNTVRGPFPYFIYVRTDANFMGLDADVEYNGKSGIDQKLSFNLLYASQLNGNPLIEIPPATINYRVSFSIHNRFLDVLKMSVEPNYTFKSLNRPDIIPIDDILLAEINQVNIFESKDQVFDLKEAPRGYFLLASSVQMSYKKFNFQLKCNNLFNTSYRIYTDRLRYFSDQTGRNFVFSLKVDL
ncbi:MAG: TonB-dependent receptor, partial [Cyclobacteriaceae bacterium]|nr:TonB-dependent receptor [Cyclobacteriaceae bacterium]